MTPIMPYLTNSLSPEARENKWAGVATILSMGIGMGLALAVRMSSPKEDSL